MRANAIALGDMTGRITLLEIVCRCCERRRRLSVDWMIDASHRLVAQTQHLDGLPHRRR